MKACAACHTDLPKDSYSKKQWKLDEFQRRCKVCITDNREIQQPSQQNDDTNTSTNEIIKSINSICLEDDEKISDEELFKQPPTEDCPICFLRMPYLGKGRRYQTCCGKVICSGCVHAVEESGAHSLCPFCRSPHPDSDKEMFKREKNRVKEKDDAQAMYNIGVYNSEGFHGYPQDYAKALELWHRSGERGYAGAYCSIGNAYQRGEGVKVDMKKAQYYYELAALGGSASARLNLGNIEILTGNTERALKHYMVSVTGGNDTCLKQIQHLFSQGRVTKQYYREAVRAYQEYLREIKSSQRDEAAAAHEDFRYY